MGTAFQFLFLLTMVVAATPYRDYPGSRMPDYGLDDETHEMRPTPDDFVDRIPHSRTSVDYRYDEEGDSRKPDSDMEVDNTVINESKRFSPKSNHDDIPVDIYNAQEEIIPEKTPRKRKLKVNRRKQARFNSVGGSKPKSTRNRNVVIDDIDNVDYRVREDDYRDNEEKEAERSRRREIINRQARRKPRERPLNLILRDSDGLYSKNNEDIDEKRSNKPGSSKEYEFEDMRRVNELKEKLSATSKRTTAMLESPGTSPTQESANQDANNDDASVTSSKITSTPGLERAGLNKSEMSLAERSRLSIMNKINKKEKLHFSATTKPPVLMQVTNQLQTVVMVEPYLNQEVPGLRQVMDDSPERIGVAKKLMRRKLVGNSRSVKELTDNWDEMICDYIDVNLLNVASRVYFSSLFILASSFVSSNYF